MSSRATTLRRRFRTRVEALQQAIQRPETVTRSSTLQVVNTGVEDIDPPDDIDEFYDLYEDINLIRANLNQFVSDVVKPGARVRADDDTTEGWFMGGEDLPAFSDGDLGGFLDRCYVIDQTHQSFEPLLKQAVLNRWVRGTFLSEVLKEDNEDAESQITGYRPIRPETVSARTYEGTNILIDPDPTADANQDIDIELTKRDEAAAYVQFDDSSILGRRLNGFDESSVFLSQHDVIKQTLDQNIGGEDAEDGVFGVSIIQAIKDDAEEYRDIKRNLTKAIQAKAWGIWSAQFNTEFIETGPGAEDILQEWDTDDQDDWVSDVDSIGPGDIIGHDGSIDLNKFEGEIPDITPVLRHYVDDIISPLPAPKYTVGFETDINQFVTEQQDQRYQQVIQEERQLQEAVWTDAFREVAERHDRLDPAGLHVEIQPEEDESPVMSLDAEDMDRLATFTGAMADLFGPGGAPAFVDEDTLLDLVLQLPEDAAMAGEAGEELDEALDEADPEVREQFEALVGARTAEADD